MNEGADKREEKPKISTNCDFLNNKKNTKFDFCQTLEFHYFSFYYLLTYVKTRLHRNIITHSLGLTIIFP